jgi:hypothetical protein
MKRLLLLIAVLIMCCDNKNEHSINYKTGKFPELVTNFGELNTIYNDMNLAPGVPPIINKRFVLYLSSDRSANSDDFDVFSHEVELAFNQNDGSFSFNVYGIDTVEYNSDSNEYGPLLLHLQRSFWFQSDPMDTNMTTFNSWSRQCYDSTFFSFFASNRNSGNGDLDIYLTTLYSLHLPELSFHEKTNSVLAASAFNSTANDCYITFGPQNTAFFCSDRTGDYDIYYLRFSEEITAENHISIFSDSSRKAQVNKLSIVNSSFNDKCPFIYDSTMYFISDRDGGNGGYDIWYSILDDGKWSTPSCMSDTINSAYNEYRPVVIGCPNFNNTLLMFSSERPGGKGGYDIYYTGL